MKLEGTIRTFSEGALKSRSDLLGLAAAIWTVGAVTALSGVVVAVRMYETHRRAGGGPAPLTADTDPPRRGGPITMMWEQHR